MSNYQKLFAKHLACVEIVSIVPDLTQHDSSKVSISENFTLSQTRLQSDLRLRYN